MFRYEEGSDKFIELFFEVIEKDFQEYEQLNIKLLFDIKKKVTKGELTLGNIEIPNEKVKYFSKDKIATDGYDYILIINKVAFDLATDTDRKRLIAHELQHIFIDDKGTPKIIDHDIKDFQEEVMKNADDPRWAEKLAMEVKAKYEDAKPQKKK